MPMTAAELCAAALVKIGARPISDLAEDTAEAACARRLYPIARDLLLGLHPWSFTLAQARLTAESASPLADFACAFALPPDHLRTILAYQRRVPEEELPAFFLPLIVTRLAAEFCIPLTEGSGRAMDLYRLAEAELRSARLIDSQQATPQAFEDFTLIGARLG
jgi:hypothetical protein